MPKSKPQYPAEFRQQIIELARVGRTPAQLSREFGPTAQSIANWIAQDGRDRGTPLPGKEGLNTAEREELVRLRRGHSNVKQLPFSKFSLGVPPRTVTISRQIAGGLLVLLFPLRLQRAWDRQASSVHKKFGARDVACSIGAQECNASRDFLRSAVPPQRNLLRAHCQSIRHISSTKKLRGGA
jgi:transposase